MRHNATYAVSGISGDPAPSAADIQVTRLWEASHKRVYVKCRIMGSGRELRWWVSTVVDQDGRVSASHNYRASRKVIRWERAGDNRRAAGSRSSVSRQRCFIFKSAST